VVNITKIKALAKEKGISITFLCQKVGQGAWYLNDVAKGKAPMPPERLSIIAELLGTTAEYLCDDSDIKEKAPAKSESNFTETELAIIEMYRALDDAGKITVGTVLKSEYDRTARAKGLILSTVAARSADGEETAHTEYLPDLSKIPADDTDL